MKNIEIIEAKYLKEYEILLIFNDNKSLIIDFKQLLNNSPYKNEQKYLDKDRFRQFKIEMGDLIWNDYDMCFQAKNLYNNILRKSTY